MNRSNILKESLNKEIYRIAEDTPGIRIGTIANITGKPYNTVRYRIIEMQRRGILEIDDESTSGASKVYIREAAEV